MTTPSEFAMHEAALIRRAPTDAQWHELLKSRPSLKDAFAARGPATQAVPADKAPHTGADM